MGRAARSITDLLKKLVPSRRSTPSEPVDAERLRVEFKARYHHFKLLLTANNKALEIMAEIDEALRGEKPFGMTFVRGRCTAAAANVFQMIKHLNALASDKYGTLYGSFKTVQSGIAPLIERKKTLDEGPLALPMEEVGLDLADRVGSKMARIGELKNRLHLTVPDGFVVTAQAFERFMHHNGLQSEINRRLQACESGGFDRIHELSSGIRQLIIRSDLPAEVEEALVEQYRALETRVREAVAGEAVRVAMRSSALGEDRAETSFAGQYRSELNVSAESVVQAYKEVIASKYGVSAMTYRLNRGIPDEDADMCVGCMRMVDAVSGGVTYSRDPVDIRDDAVLINASWGLPKAVVDGSVAVDAFSVARGKPMSIVKRDIAAKAVMYIANPVEGLSRKGLEDEMRRASSLTDEQILELADIAVRIESEYGVPQDIEWAVDANGRIHILQCRPLRQTAPARTGNGADAGTPAGDDVILEGGVTASPGVAAGEVFIARKEADALRFPEGGVLVTVQASPRWASLLGRASAVIAEQGSVAGHLAGVAREFDVPALFGVPGAVDRLGDRLGEGQTVTVDADNRRVLSGRVEALLRDRRKPVKLMEGSPVYECMKDAARWITPLNLLDPDAPTFRADGCRTFHDITRYCHEKSVYEMFRFGKENRFPEKSSKQLVCDVPMQFWILDLDDGFHEATDGRTVKLENIRSVPMLALWRGMVAVPWEGPPPVDAGGFMSVLMEATANPALDPSMGSPYAAKNYFMISSNYASLQSRFGFHFSIVEALVGDRPSENYISFQFKGGAANPERRMMRARFVADLLDEYDFRTDVKEDAAFARLEGYDRPIMESRLMVLGYLVIHTRQLDMVMSDNASRNHYRAKILNDLEGFLTD